MKCPSCNMGIVGATRVCPDHGDEGSVAADDPELKNNVVQCPRCGALLFYPEGGDLRLATDDEVRQLPEPIRNLLRHMSAASFGQAMGGAAFQIRGACPVCHQVFNTGAGMRRESFNSQRHIALCFGCGAALMITGCVDNVLQLRTVTEEEWERAPEEIRVMFAHGARIARQTSGQRQQ